MSEIFKSYDVRGIYPTDINEKIVYDIGRALVQFLGARSIAVGYDNRHSSPTLFHSLTRGINEAGADVISLGHLSTPMLYFASAHLGVDGAVMITASHNPPEWNGLKFTRKNAVPIGLSSGLSDIRDIIRSGNFLEAKHPGTVIVKNIKPDYDALLTSFADIGGKRFRIATDTAHSMGVLELPVLRAIKGLCLCTTLYDTLRKAGSCPHEANPMNTATLVELQHAVRELRADMGVAFDGDADRVGFVDETGAIVPMDLVTALLAQSLLPKHPGKTALYDLRSSRTVREAIESLGCVAHESRVGHAHIKKQMVEEGAVMAGESSGHYYFSLGGYSAEMGSLPVILMLNLLARTGKKLSQLVEEVKKYYHSGEINLRTENIPELLGIIRSRYHDGKLSELDGIKIEYPSWWFSLRASNTEPLIRLNLEAKTQDEMEQRKSELLALLGEGA
jgi:phosphomannomutase